MEIRFVLGVNVCMVSRSDIKRADKNIENGYLSEAKDFYLELLTDTDDPVFERIAENRLSEIEKKKLNAKNCCQLNLDSESEENGYVVCFMGVIYDQAHLKGLVADLFTKSHKKNYPFTSSISIEHSAAQQFTIEMSGYGIDQRCDWCKLFRENLVYYIGKQNIMRCGHCPNGIEA